MKRYKNFLCSLLFLAILMGLLAAGSRIVEPKNNEKASGMRNAQATGFLTERENSLDYILIGDSETYSSTTPMQLWRDYGYTGYICGTPGQHMEDTFGYLKAFCEVQKPKLVIFEANALYRSSGIQDDISRIVTRTIEKNIPIFEYHNRWKSLSLADMGSVNYTWRNYLKGFVPTWKNKPWTGAPDYMRKTDKSLPIKEINRFYFDKIYNFCKERAGAGQLELSEAQRRQKADEGVRCSLSGYEPPCGQAENQLADRFPGRRRPHELQGCP